MPDPETSGPDLTPLPRVWEIRRLPPAPMTQRETRVVGEVLEDGESVRVLEAEPTLELLERTCDEALAEYGPSPTTDFIVKRLMPFIEATKGDPDE